MTASRVKKVKWKAGKRFKCDPQLALEELEEIKTKNGELMPEEVVKSAKRKASALHDDFDWNDATAAHKQRLTTARHMIGGIEVVYRESPGRPVRMYSAVIRKNSEPKNPQYVYVNTREALGNPIEHQQLFSQALRDLSAFRIKYETLSELSPIFRAIDETIEELQPVG